MADYKYEADRRWAEEIPHDPRSEALAHAIADIDWENGGMLDLKFGGDGDAGETLMYMLDIHFEREDAKWKSSERFEYPT